MKPHIILSEFEPNAATLRIEGRTPAEAKKNSQAVLLAIKKKDPTSMFKVPRYEGFSSESGKHIYSLRVVFGTDPARTAEVVRSLV